MAQDFLVRRDDLTQVQLSDANESQPMTGEVVLKVDRFAFTANNVTYGVAGDMIGYWKFFPASEGWGRIPVWGIGTVTASEHPELNIGDRYYGYYPMSSELKVKPEKVSSRGFVDAAEHRAALPVVYNQYALMNTDNGYDEKYDNHYMVYRPLFTTSFVLDDFFADNDFFGATNMILGSASSKTAFGLAFMLKRRGDINIIGLTSKANAGFVKSLGLYNGVLTYDAVELLPQDKSAYVDMSGNRQVLSAVHHHLGDNLVNSCGVGITHWKSRDGEAPATLPGAKPTMFFAPTQIVKRNEELGAQAYQRQIGEATAAFFSKVDQWVTIEEHPYTEVENVFRTVLDGASPNLGYVVLGAGA